jgi:hypothetical protein
MAGDIASDATLRIHPDMLANIVFPSLMLSIGDEIPRNRQSWVDIKH